MNGASPYHQGYHHPLYGQSFQRHGRLCMLSNSGAQVLLREIPHTTLTDAVSIYPLFCCANPDALSSDLAQFVKEECPVSVTLVTNPLFSDDVIDEWHRTFDVVRPYKQHYLANLQTDLEAFVDRRHLRKALSFFEKGGRVIVGEQGCNSAFLKNSTVQLYAGLAQRKRLSEFASFSEMELAMQMQVPGLTIISAAETSLSEPQELIGTCWFYGVGKAVYYHIGAHSEKGYAMGASFAIFWTALKLFREQGFETLVLGAGAGIVSSSEGLARFKRGWSTHSRQNYILGAIGNVHAYEQLAGKKPYSNYFPAYRTP